MYITDKYEVKSYDDEILLLPKQYVGENNVLILNRLATKIYQMIEMGLDINEILKTIRQKYDVEEDELFKDVNEVLTLLVEHGAVDL